MESPNRISRQFFRLIVILALLLAGCAPVGARVRLIAKYPKTETHTLTDGVQVNETRYILVYEVCPAGTAEQPEPPCSQSERTVTKDVYENTPLGE